MTNILVPKLLGFAKNVRFLHFQHLLFSLGWTLHVACIKYKIKRTFTFFLVNTKYMSSCEFKTSEFSQVHSTRENSDVFNTLDEIYLVFTSKR